MRRFFLCPVGDEAANVDDARGRPTEMTTCLLPALRGTKGHRLHLHAVLECESEIRQRPERHISLARENLSNEALRAPKSFGELLPRNARSLDELGKHLRCFK